MAATDASIKRMILVFIFPCLFILFILLTMQGSTTYEETILCLTPWIVNPLYGKVINYHDSMPVSGAEITIKNIPIESKKCENLSYISTLEFITDDNGEFKYWSGYVAHPNQYFDITISASNCKPYHADKVSFSVFLIPQGAPFLINCE